MRGKLQGVPRESRRVSEETEGSERSLNVRRQSAEGKVDGLSGEASEALQAERRSNR